MRVGFDLRRLHRTGIGRYARNIFAACAAESPATNFLAVVNDEGALATARALAPGCECLIAPARQYSAQEILRAPRMASDVHVWHSPHPYHLGLGAKYATVLSLLDLTQVDHAVGLKNWLAREPLRALIRTACQRATCFAAISETTKDLFVSQMRIPAHRVHVTPLAPDPSFALPVAREAVAGFRKAWSLSTPVILYVGTAQPHKNLRKLIQAIGLLHQRLRQPKPLLVVVGPIRSVEKRRLEATARLVGFQGSIRWLGWLPDHELRHAYHAADVLALPSLSEGFGLTLLEAMQCGTPCVASDIPVLREVAGHAAVFADPESPEAIASALAAVLWDSGISSDLRRLGHANLRRFSWRAAAQGTLAAYEAAAQSER